MTPTEVEGADLSDYRQELILSLSSARVMATKSVQKAQRKYKAQYDKRSSSVDYKVGDWVLVRFPQDETGPEETLPPMAWAIPHSLS